jgi:predicted nucleotidyltransferase
MSFSVIKHGELIPSDILETVSQRNLAIAKAVNKEFWETSINQNHNFFVGSYGRGTAIDDSDIDILVWLPQEDYMRFDQLKGNGQSRLLQSVKDAIGTTYPNTEIKADGQVVVLNFSDGMKIEVLPAFVERNSLGVTFKYPDTNQGGKWRSTDPLAEQSAMRDKNKSSNGLLFDTCKHIRRMHLDCFGSYPLSGIVIDSFVYEAMKNWQWTPPGQKPNPSAISYESSLLKYYNDITINGLIDFQIQAPGSGMNVDSSDSYKCLGKILNKMVE